MSNLFRASSNYHNLQIIQETFSFNAVFCDSRHTGESDEVNVDTNAKGSAGIHRTKVKVDRLWLRQHMDALGYTLKTLSEALARELGTKPLDISSMSRRMSGKDRWPIHDVHALAKLFGESVTETLRAVGGAAESPTVGTIAADGTVDITIQSDEEQQVLTFVTGDALKGATLTFRHAKMPAPAGVVILEQPAGVHRLRQVLAITGTQVVTSTVFGPPRIEHFDHTVAARKVLFIGFP